MRVLHIYSGNLYGGIETMLVTLARERRLCPEMESHFALSFEGRLSEELRAACVPVHMLGNVRASQPLTIWRARRSLGGLLQQEPFDIVICHASWAQAIFGPVVSRAQTPLVFWLHGPVDGRHWSERWARRTEPELILCNSHFTARSLPKLFPHVRAEVLYCPVAFAEKRYSKDERLATRAELKTAEDAVVIIQVSRMEAWKGHALHLEALSQLSHLSNWVCWQVGGAQRPEEALYLAEIKGAASRLGIAGRVHFAGERQDVQRLLAAADIFCQPNIGAEPFGITLVEALFTGLPVVTTALGGALEIVNDSCGKLTPPNRVEELTQSLRQLIEDSSLRLRLARSGPARARELCEPGQQLRRLDQLLSSVVHREVAA
jgi:glycosyltransferase involved in cell wall biosynthesis